MQNSQKSLILKEIRHINCVTIWQNVMYISFYLKVIMNCVKMQALQPIKLKKFYVNPFNMLKIG